jgi:hypothetical protein
MSPAARSPLTRRTTWTACLLAAGALGAAGCGTAASGSPLHHHLHRSAVVSAHGEAPTYKIGGTVSTATDCGKQFPIGSHEDATVSLSIEGRRLKADLGATSNAPSHYVSYDGELHRDGSFQLRSNWESPADLRTSVLDGHLSPTGQVSGTWTFGWPMTGPNGESWDARCLVVLHPVTSYFYFGVTAWNWRKEWHVPR